MSGISKEAALMWLVGSVIRKWREERLKLTEEKFAERYGISPRFLRMIQAGQRLPSCGKFIGMILDMDWKSRGALMIGFMRIKRGQLVGDELPPSFPEGQSA